MKVHILEKKYYSGERGIKRNLWTAEVFDHDTRKK